MIISRKSTRDFSGVDRYKNLLEKKYSAKPGQTVINNLTGEDHVSLFLACAELGLVTIISEISSFSEKLFYEKKYNIPFFVPERVNLIGVVDYCFGDDSIYSNLSEHVVDETDWTDDEPNDKILASPSSILIRFTTDSKIIEHTHEYMFSLGQRNSKLLEGNVQIEKDIFFMLAALISDVNIQYEYDVTTDIIESTVLRKWIGNVEIGTPIFIRDKNNKLVEVDDYYGVEIIDDRPYMLVPVYDVVGVMDEKYEQLDDGSYKYVGKYDKVIINNHELYLEHLNRIANEYVRSCTLVYDSVYEKVYLAVWEDQEDLHHKVMKLYYQFEDRFDISRFALLDYDLFSVNNSIDQEAIRDYFRNK
tara:strand:+ start:104 stop:1186 length:1083 start_codon:yes stop_codon:yes gene_type:complete